MVTEGVEDYLEAISKALEENEKARTNEIALELEVSASSVTEMLQKLDEKGYINYQKYQGVTLTEKGREIADDVIETHEAIKRLFIMLGVPPKKAERDACKVEHHLSDETIIRLKKFVKYIDKAFNGDLKQIKDLRE
ncbi:metal-dependent transcriptional regulator [Methanonatronarchaeum sp. AMET6-2]|uniref:metal-dependent transcriptional regulator n=1 Tax=Methanonatronarchaeum sp. AMET6-2 TaxID=2933293 RepID=UPI00121C61C6|nr:metal-dependent transcriptional regulator [Methanonatronarchaeum sp. AMET6-2]RZN62968.1 MAG: metal-dependent transcriptional regulator [Methanonatronarchaeia archaeon]UOY10733.1 metal-dependent transcriptional regulator [Methanonatronarchaeum sp. AMET6-2]